MWRLFASTRIGVRVVLFLTCDAPRWFKRLFAWLYPYVLCVRVFCSHGNLPFWKLIIWSIPSCSHVECQMDDSTAHSPSYHNFEWNWTIPPKTSFFTILAPIAPKLLVWEGKQQLITVTSWQPFQQYQKKLVATPATPKIGVWRVTQITFF
jgi:hypothetical protein